MLMFSTLFSQKKSIDNLQSSPNPFTENTEISFDSTKEQGVLLVVKNIIGKTVFNKTYWTRKGKRRIFFERKDLKPGIYIYTVQSQDNVISKRFIIKK